MGRGATTLWRRWRRACAHGPALRDPQAKMATARLAGLPTQVNVFVWLAKGRRGGDGELSVTVQENVDDSVGYALSQHGGRRLR
jgi:hypothetical protein